MPSGYGTDLAYIHDVGHGDLARNAAKELIGRLRRQNKTRGRIVDLGCGTGILARELTRAGYEVLGIDRSEAMLAIARKRAPGAQFRVGSFYSSRIPECISVTSIGECFCYLFSNTDTRSALWRLFRRIRRSLESEGILMFDVAAPGRIPGTGKRTYFKEGRNWTVLVDAEENRRRLLLTRRITSFRKIGRLYRRAHEIHRLRLFERSKLRAGLRKLGFRVSILSGYGRMEFVRGHFGVLSKKN